MVGPLRARADRLGRESLNLLFSMPLVPPYAYRALRTLQAAWSLASFSVRRHRTAQGLPGWNTKQFTFERIDADRIRLMREVEIEGETGTPNDGQKFFADDLRAEHQDRRARPPRATWCSRRRRRASPPTAWSSTPRPSSAPSTLASGIAAARRARRARPQHVRHARAGRLLLRRDDREDRPRQVPHHEGRLHHLRAADAALGDRQRQRHAEPRRLRACCETPSSRVKDVPVFYLPVLYYPIQDDDRATGFLLPTYGRRSRSRHRRSATRSSGRSTAARTPRSSTTGSFSRGSGVGAEYRYMLGRRRRATSGPTR